MCMMNRQNPERIEKKLVGLNVFKIRATFKLKQYFVTKSKNWEVELYKGTVTYYSF